MARGPSSQSTQRDAKADADVQFVDDLVAALRCKTFLIGMGTDVPASVSEGLATLSAVFQPDIERHKRAPEVPPSASQPGGRGLRAWLMQRSKP